jgi:ornithine decarboxylase
MQEMKVALSKGLNGDKIIFANPCKMPAHIRFAKENGIEMMTFDNKAELLKVHAIFPTAKMVLRILGDDSHSTMRFGSKFGANVHTEALSLLECAYSLGLAVIGVSFHVGSGCQSAEAYTNSLSLARHVFDIAEELGHPMTFLDIGGGTPGVDTEDLKFSEIARTISRDLTKMFPPHIRVIAEPGRYFASECVVLVTSIIAKRERNIPCEDSNNNNEAKEIKQIDYYISDGVYGSFNNLFFDHARAQPVPMQRNVRKSPSRDDFPVGSPSDSGSCGSPPQENGFGSPPKDSPFGSPPNKSRSTVFGPTCDSIDLICKDVELPDLEINDIVYFLNMGAYTSAAASSFNGFNPPSTVYMIS